MSNSPFIIIGSSTAVRTRRFLIGTATNCCSEAPFRRSEERVRERGHGSGSPTGSEVGGPLTTEVDTLDAASTAAGWIMRERDLDSEDARDAGDVLEESFELICSLVGIKRSEFGLFIGCKQNIEERVSDEAIVRASLPVVLFMRERIENVAALTSSEAARETALQFAVQLIAQLRGDVAGARLAIQSIGPGVFDGLVADRRIGTARQALRDRVAWLADPLGWSGGDALTDGERTEILELKKTFRPRSAGLN